MVQEAHHLSDHSAQVLEEWMDLYDWGMDFNDGSLSKVFFNKKEAVSQEQQSWGN